MNRMTRIIRAKNAQVPIETVLNLSAFDLDQILKRRPTFLEPEYPFEWTGVYDLAAGKYELMLEEGPDPEMSLVAFANQGESEEELKDGAESCVRLYAEKAKSIEPGNIIPFGEHINLKLEDKGNKSFILDIEKGSKIGLYTQHTAEEFNMKIIKSEDNNSKEIPFNIERFWQAEHEHDDEVTSIAIERFGDVDPEKLNTWLGRLLSEKGVDIFRTKGFISYSGNPQRIVFQGVHMLFTAQPDKEWGNEPRRNQLVFIGRNLDEKEMKEGFEKCLI